MKMRISAWKRGAQPVPRLRNREFDLDAEAPFVDAPGAGRRPGDEAEPFDADVVRRRAERELQRNAVDLERRRMRPPAEREPEPAERQSVFRILPADEAELDAAGEGEVRRPVRLLDEAHLLDDERDFFFVEKLKAVRRFQRGGMQAAEGP